MRIFLLFTMVAALSGTGCGSKKPMFAMAAEPKVKVEFRLAKPLEFQDSIPQVVVHPAVEGKYERFEQTLHVAKVPILTSADIAGTSPAPQAHNSGFWQVDIYLTSEAKMKFAEFTADNYGHYLAIYLDGQFLLAPVMMAHITDGILAISYENGTEADATKLAKDLVGQ